MYSILYSPSVENEVIWYETSTHDDRELRPVY